MRIDNDKEATGEKKQQGQPPPGHPRPPLTPAPRFARAHKGATATRHSGTGGAGVPHTHVPIHWAERPRVTPRPHSAGVRRHVGQHHGGQTAAAAAATTKATAPVRPR